ncbi:hypothetical protein JCM5296_003177 [Sporobolomyces johnsonii]
MSSPSSHLSLEDIATANRRAQIDGVAAGTCAGFLGGFLSTKLFKQSRNVGLLSGVLTGSVVGYIFTQESLRLQLAKAEAAAADLRRHLGSAGEGGEAQEQQQWDLSKGERGVGGQEGLEDRYATTRGDH